jgi:hypothetical protein
MVIIVGALMVVLAKNGAGRHRVFLSQEEYMYYNKVRIGRERSEAVTVACADPQEQIFYIDVIFYIAGLAFIKLHVLLQYYRLFSIEMRKVTLWVIAICCLWGAASTFACIFICDPIPAFWDRRIRGVCIPLVPQWYTNAVGRSLRAPNCHSRAHAVCSGNIVTDLIVFALPIRVLWRLKLDRMQRFSLVGVFCLGFFTCCISMIRLSFLDILKGDETYHNVTTAGWTIGEMTCAMVATCMPTLRPLLFKIAPHLRSSRDTGSNRKPSAGQQLATHTVGGRHIPLSGSDADDSRRRLQLKRSKGDDTLLSELTGSTVELQTDVEAAMEMTDFERTDAIGSLTDQSRTHSIETISWMDAARQPTPSVEAEMALGLRRGTTTMIETSPNEDREDLSGGEDLESANGIHVRRDVVQLSGPAEK